MDAHTSMLTATLVADIKAKEDEIKMLSEELAFAKEIALVLLNLLKCCDYFVSLAVL